MSSRPIKRHRCHVLDEHRRPVGHPAGDHEIVAGGEDGPGIGCATIGIEPRRIATIVTPVRRRTWSSPTDRPAAWAVAGRRTQSSASPPEDTGHALRQLGRHGDVPAEEGAEGVRGRFVEADQRPVALVQLDVAVEAADDGERLAVVVPEVELRPDPGQAGRDIGRGHRDLRGRERCRPADGDG